jgi:hypothetical protein
MCAIGVNWIRLTGFSQGRGARRVTVLEVANLKVRREKILLLWFIHSEL